MGAADLEVKVDLSKIAIDVAGVGALSATSGAAEVDRFVDAFFAALDQGAQALGV